MRFRCQMHDNIGLFGIQQRRHAGAIADVQMDKAIMRIAGHRSQGFQIAGIGKFVEVYHLGALRNQSTHHGGPDKACAAGDDNLHEPTIRKSQSDE